MKSMTFLALSLTFFANLAMAADAPVSSVGAKEPSAMSSEQRQKMALHHEKMAVCLRSDRPVSDCRDEMMKACGEAMGKEGCPMMGGKGGRGMHRRMMDRQAKDKE